MTILPIHLHVFPIFTLTLPSRAGILQTSLKLLEDITKRLGNEFSTYPITNYEPNDVLAMTPELEKTMIDYSKIGDEDFDKSLQQLNTGQLSNFLKQKEAIHQIVEIAKTETPTHQHIYMVLEDDAVFLPEFQNNLLTFLKSPRPAAEWDIFLLCASSPDRSITDYQFVNARQMFKILPSKEAYCITPATANKLLPFLDKIRYTYRFQLSYWIHTNPTVRMLCPSLRISIEGSKVGFVPSSLTENNILLYNAEFMELFKMMISGEIDVARAKQLYKIVEHLKSPEIMHLYAVILFKQGKAEQAKDLFIDAVQKMVEKNGCINARSELLNNAINIHGVVQEDLASHRKNPSKYATVAF